MRSGRIADGADALWIDIQIFRMGAQPANRALHVFDLCRECELWSETISHADRYVPFFGGFLDIAEVPIFIARPPSAAMYINDDRRRRSEVLGRRQMQSQLFSARVAVDDIF